MRIIWHLIILLCMVGLTWAQAAPSAPYEFRTETISCKRQSDYPFLGYLCMTDSDVLSDEEIASIRQLADALISRDIYSILITYRVYGNSLQDERDKLMFSSSRYWLRHRDLVDVSSYLASIIRIGATEWIRARHNIVVTRKIFRNGIELIGTGVAEPVYLYGTAVRGEAIPRGKHGVTFMVVKQLNTTTCTDAARILLYNLRGWNGYVRCKGVPQFFAETNFYSVYPFFTESEESMISENVLVQSMLCEGTNGAVKCWYDTDEGE